MLRGHRTVLLGQEEVCRRLEAQLTEKHHRLLEAAVTLCGWEDAYHALEAQLAGVGQAGVNCWSGNCCAGPPDAASSRPCNSRALLSGVGRRDRARRGPHRPEVSTSPLSWLSLEKGAWLWQLLRVDLQEALLGPLKV